LASGDSSGNVQVWQLNWRLATLQSGEQKALDDLGSSSSGDADSATDATDDSNSGSGKLQRHETKHDDDDDHAAYGGSSSYK
jgi:hypothetical protein